MSKVQRPRDTNDRPHGSQLRDMATPPLATVPRLAHSNVGHTLAHARALAMLTDASTRLPSIPNAARSKR